MQKTAVNLDHLSTVAEVIAFSVCAQGDYRGSAITKLLEGHAGGAEYLSWYDELISFIICFAQYHRFCCNVKSFSLLLPRIFILIDAIDNRFE